MGRGPRGRAAGAASAAFLVCKSCKLTPLQLFIRVCSSSETLLLKQAFICVFKSSEAAARHSPALPRTQSKGSARNRPGSCQALLEQQSHLIPSADKAEQPV